MSGMFVMVDKLPENRNMTNEFTTRSAAETVALGQTIGKTLTGGRVIALIGNLGTGKTHLTKGIAQGLGVDQDELVTSPTFVLVNEYDTADGRQIYHIDAYRLESVAEFEALGIDDYIRPDSLVLVEWADRVWDALAPLNPICIRLAHAGGDTRTITLQTPTPENP